MKKDADGKYESFYDLVMAEAGRITERNPTTSLGWPVFTPRAARWLEGIAETLKLRDKEEEEMKGMMNKGVRR